MKLFIFNVLILILNFNIEIFSQTILINEVVSSNNSTLDPEGNTSDWIEFKNVSGNSQSLANCYISNDSENLLKYKYSNNLP